MNPNFFPLAIRAPQGQVFLLTVLLAGTLAGRLRGGALENYVTKPDDSFRWTQLDQKPDNGATLTHLELTSQRWRESVWHHHVRVVQPERVRVADCGFLFITGDGDGSKQLGIIRTVSQRAGIVAAVVTKVPNQPLYGGRKEDALIAYTFDEYLKTGDESWPLLFPMVKSAVRAMDAVTEFTAKSGGGRIERWVLAGASKRGWTTWLAGAADPRVKGIAPMVIDMLNMKAQTAWAEKVYGAQSEKIRDYTDLGLIARMDEPGMVRLRGWVDPYSYRQRYNIPKLILLGTNDPYWTVDALRHYWSELPAPKLIFQTPNAGHDLGGGAEALPSLAAFVQMVAAGQPLPQLDWQFERGNPTKVSVKVDRAARQFRLWTATSADRDFRDDKWAMQELEGQAGGTRAVATVAAPDKGYRAYLVEAVLASPDGHEYKLSTEARVTPDDVK